MRYGGLPTISATSRLEPGRGRRPGAPRGEGMADRPGAGLPPRATRSGAARGRARCLSRDVPPLRDRRAGALGRPHRAFARVGEPVSRADARCLGHQAHAGGQARAEPARSGARRPRMRRAELRGGWRDTSVRLATRAPGCARPGRTHRAGAEGEGCPLRMANRRAPRGRAASPSPTGLGPRARSLQGSGWCGPGSSAALSARSQRCRPKPGVWKRSRAYAHSTGNSVSL